jgi:hypothetical protein
MNLAIVGSRNGLSKDKIPKYKPGWELWSCNALYGTASNIDYWISHKGWFFHRWFELHTRRWLEKHYGKQGFKQHLRALDMMGSTVYVWGEPWPEVSKSVEYPKEAVESVVPHGRYHAGSFDWMMALAVSMRNPYGGVEDAQFGEIHLYGVDLGPLDGEPVSARPCLEYWCGVAEGGGITVVVHGGSLFHNFQYVMTEAQYGATDLDNVLKVAPKRGKAVGVRL